MTARERSEPGQIEPAEPERPVSFIIEACSFPRRRSASSEFVEGLSEAEDKILIDGRLPVFSARVDALRNLLRKRFPADVARWESS